MPIPLNMPPGATIARAFNELNQFDRVTALELARAGLQQREVVTQTLSDLSPDLGLVEAGEFRSGNGVELGSGFTGVRIGYPGFSYVGLTWPFVTVNNDALMAGIGFDGRFYAAGGALVIDNLGITATGINYFQRFQDAASPTRIMEFGLTQVSGTAAGYIAWYSPAGANLQTNGDLELGALTDWTQTGSTWDVVTSPVHGGTYAARLTLTDVIDSNLQLNGGFEAGDTSKWTVGGTGTTSVVTTAPRSGTYHLKVVQTGSQTFTLTTNLGGTPRFPVTAGLDYAVFGAADYAVSGGGFTTQTLSIKWYNSVPTLLSTDSMTFALGSGAYALSAMLKTAPATAVWAEVSASFTRAAGGGTSTIYIDDIQFGAVSLGTLYTNFGGGTPRMAVTAGTGYQVADFVQTDQGAAYFNVSKVEMLWYDAITGGLLLSTSTAPISVVNGTWVNTAVPLVAPVGALGAEVKFTFERSALAAAWGTTVHVYVDDVTFGAVTINRSIQFLPNFTFMNGPADFQEIAAPAAPASGYGSMYWDSSDHSPHLFNSYGQNNRAGLVTISPYSSYASDAAEHTVATITQKKGTMGPNGRVDYWFEVSFIETGTAQNLTIKFYWGSYSAIIRNAASTGGSTNRYNYRLHYTVYSVASEAVQRGLLTVEVVGNQAKDTLGTATVQHLWSDTTIDTSVATGADVICKVTGDWTNSTSTGKGEGTGLMNGPYLA